MKGEKWDNRITEFTSVSEIDSEVLRMSCGSMQNLRPHERLQWGGNLRQALEAGHRINLARGAASAQYDYIEASAGVSISPEARLVFIHHYDARVALDALTYVHTRRKFPYHYGASQTILDQTMQNVTSTLTARDQEGGPSDSQL